MTRSLLFGEGSRGKLMPPIIPLNPPGDISGPADGQVSILCAQINHPNCAASSLVVQRGVEWSGQPAMGRSVQWLRML